MKKIKPIFVKCKSNLAGIKQVFLSPHNEYKPYEVEKDGDELIRSVNRLFYLQKVSQIKFDEITTFDVSGNISFDVNLSFVVWENQRYKSLVGELINKRFDAVMQLNNGLFIYAGFKNGLELKNCSYQTGQSKSELIGYNLSFKGMEENPYLRFSNMNDVGFKAVESDNVLFVLSTKNNPIKSENNLIEII